MSNFKTIAIFAAVMTLTAGHVQANGFANGSFETAASAVNPPGGATFFAAGWLAAPTGNPAMRVAGGYNSAFAALLTVPTGFGGSTLFQNSVDHGGMAPLGASAVGLTPMLTFWAKGDVSTTGNALFSLRYLNNTGTILGNSGNQFFHNAINPNTWSQISFQGAPIPVGTEAVFLEMNTAVGPLLDGRPNAVYIDGINLAPIPEPETYALMLAGLAGLGLMVRRRRA
jgi:hypothetical protein